MTIEYHNTRLKLHTAKFELNGSENSKDPEGVKYVPHGWKKKEDERVEMSEDEEEDVFENQNDFTKKLRKRWKESRKKRREMDKEDWLYGSPNRKERLLKKKRLEEKWALKESVKTLSKRIVPVGRRGAMKK